MSTSSILLIWAAAILIIVFFWWLIKNTDAIGWVVRLLFPKSYWEPPVDQSALDEYDMYD